MIARPYAPKKLYGNRDFWPQGTAYTNTQGTFEAGVINGKIYCPAGLVSGAYTNLTRVYDPKGAIWSTAANITTSRMGASTGVVNGLMYVIGGVKIGDVYQTLNECYNPVTDSWSSKTAMTAAKQLAFTAVVGTKIYVIGGYSGSAQATNYCYDTVADSWSTKTAMTAAKYSGACVVYGKKIYCISGYTTTIDSTVYCYDTIADSWSTKTAIPTAVYNVEGQAQVIGNYAYVFGGFNGSAGITTIQRYDLLADKWSTVGNLPAGRYCAGCAYVDGTVYLLGGADTAYRNTVYKNTFSKKADWLYSPSIAASHTDNRAFKGVG